MNELQVRERLPAGGVVDDTTATIDLVPGHEQRQDHDQCQENFLHAREYTARA